jgi:hypothetical protein
MSTPLRTSLTACFAAASVLAVGALAFSRTDGMIERSFAQGFGENGGAMPTARSRLSLPGAFDPAHLHLSSLPAVGASGTPVAVGDTITLAQRQGGAVAYEVVEVRPLTPHESQDGGSGELTGLMLVTAIASGQHPAQTVRFVVDGPAPARVAPARPRAL